MAKFFVTNNKSFYDLIIERVSESPFKIGFTFNNEEIYAVSVKKLFYNNVNGWRHGANMVITIGTPIYKASLENDGIIDDFNDNVNEFRKDLIGQYSIVVKQDKNVTIFCDPAGCYSTYYYYDGIDFLVSNDISDMASVLGKKVKPSYINILEEACQNSILGGESLYEGIRRLAGREKILISNNNRFEVIQLPIQKRNAVLSYEERVTSLADKLKYKASVISDVLGCPDIFMTGGLDARISLASYLSVGVKPALHYGIGNSAVTNTIKNDLEIAKLFAQRYGLTLYEEDWSTPSPVYRDWEKYIEKYGVLAKNYAASDSIMKSFENLPNNFSTFGYGGELYRNLTWIENRKKAYFTAEEFVDEYYIGGTMSRQLTGDIVGYRDRLIKKVSQLCLDYGINPMRIENKDNFYFMLEYRCYADTYIVNMMNQMKYSNLLLFEYDCLELTDVSTKEMNNSRFMLDVIKCLYEDVLEIPIFSHCVVRCYDKEKGTLLPVELSLRSKIASYLPSSFAVILKRKIVKFKRRKARLKKVLYKERGDNVNSLKKDCTILNKRHSLYPGFNNDSVEDIRYLIHYYILLEAVESK